jgi:YidC/Oxa1 family membrane protein insertase
MKSKKGMMRQVRFTPYLKELEKKYEGNKQKYQEEVAKLYKEEHISPTGGCLWSLIQYPILLALYRAIRYPITIMMGVPAEAYKTIQELLAKLGYTAPTTGQGAAYGQISSRIYKFPFQPVCRHQRQTSENKLYIFPWSRFGQQPKWATMDFLQTASRSGRTGLFSIPSSRPCTGYVASRIGMTSKRRRARPRGRRNNKMS